MGVGTFKLVVKHELGPARAEKKIIWYPALWICVLLVIVYHHSKLSQVSFRKPLSHIMILVCSSSTDRFLWDAFCEPTNYYFYYYFMSSPARGCKQPEAEISRLVSWRVV